LITVLVTGTDGGAAQSIIKCLRLANKTKLEYKIITIGVDPLCIGIYTGDKGYLVSKDWDKYKEELREICLKEGVDIIIPGSDIELTHFYKEKKYYEQNCPPILIDYKNVPLARDKYLLQERLRTLGFPYLKTWKSNEIEKVDCCPVVVKPRFGFGSKLLFKDVRRKYLKPIVNYVESHGWEAIIQQQAEGNEYSCMVLRATDGTVLGHTIAWSVKKFGQSYKTIVKVGDPTIEKLILELTERIKSIGPLSIQLIKDVNTNQYKVFEVNARFSGAQIVRAIAGVNMVDMAIKNFLFGKKEKKEVKNVLIGYWYHDFAYSDWETYERVLLEKKIGGKKIKCPKLL